MDLERDLLLYDSTTPLCTHLPDLLTHNGEHPEVQNILGDSWTQGRRALEVHQQHVGKQQEEKEVHQDVAQKRSDGSKPELTPSGHYERTLRRSLRLRYACKQGDVRFRSWLQSELD